MTRRPLRVAVAAAVCAMLTGPVTAESLVEYQVDKSSYSINEPLTGQAGDAENGKKVAVSRRKGNCLACHVMPIPEEAFHGLIAPPLTGVGARYTEGQLRLRMVDAKLFNPNTIMPSFYKVEGIHRPLPEFEGKPVLTAQEIEDVIAYLATLK